MGTLSLSRPEPQAADDLSALIRPGTGGTDSFEVAVKGARCAGCIAKIEQGVSAIPGVENARLNLSTGKLTVLGRAIAPPSRLKLKVRRQIRIKKSLAEDVAVLYCYLRYNNSGSAWY